MELIEEEEQEEEEAQLLYQHLQEQKYKQYEEEQKYKQYEQYEQVLEYEEEMEGKKEIKNNKSQKLDKLEIDEDLNEEQVEVEYKEVEVELEYKELQPLQFQQNNQFQQFKPNNESQEQFSSNDELYDGSNYNTMPSSPKAQIEALYVPKKLLVPPRIDYNDRSPTYREARRKIFDVMKKLYKKEHKIIFCNNSNYKKFNNQLNRLKSNGLTQEDFWYGFEIILQKDMEQFYLVIKWLAKLIIGKKLSTIGLSFMTSVASLNIVEESILFTYDWKQIDPLMYTYDVYELDVVARDKEHYIVKHILEVLGDQIIKIIPDKANFSEPLGIAIWYGDIWKIFGVSLKCGEFYRQIQRIAGEYQDGLFILMKEAERIHAEKIRIANNNPNEEAIGGEDQEIYGNEMYFHENINEEMDFDINNNINYNYNNYSSNNNGYNYNSNNNGNNNKKKKTNKIKAPYHVRSEIGKNSRSLARIIQGIYTSLTNTKVINDFDKDQCIFHV